PAVGVTKIFNLHVVLELHQRIIARSAGSVGVRDRGIQESALAEPEMAFGG
ncbi:MAG: hypothetical protein JWN98_473, partial [Abditibacteriota bacterium]|nr:hypothetical protein [Abditibacteriota bacterium]